MPAAESTILIRGRSTTTPPASALRAQGETPLGSVGLLTRGRGGIVRHPVHWRPGDLQLAVAKDTASFTWLYHVRRASAPPPSRVQCTAIRGYSPGQIRHGTPSVFKANSPGWRATIGSRPPLRGMAVQGEFSSCSGQAKKRPVRASYSGSGSGACDLPSTSSTANGAVGTRRLPDLAVAVA